MDLGIRSSCESYIFLASVRLIEGFLGQIEKQQSLIADLESDLGDKHDRRNKLAATVESLESEAVDIRNEISNLAWEQELKHRTCEQLKLERGQLVREKLGLEHELTLRSEAVASAENNLARSKEMKNVVAGLKSIERIVQFLVGSIFIAQLSLQ
jgi:chromosome segregation ATPase